MSTMARVLALLALLAHLLVLTRQEESVIAEEEAKEHDTNQGNPSYSYSYGVSDASTGDVKSVWESKEGDTVKGHYSVVEPDGSMRSVEYSAGPDTGFTAVVKNDGEPVAKKGRSLFEEKSQRDFGKFYDFSEDSEDERDSYLPTDRKRAKHPFESLFKDYSLKKRPKFPNDLEASDFTHSITIKHPLDEAGNEPHSHQGINYDPNCKNKHNKETSNFYGNLVEFDISKRYPANKLFQPASYDEDSQNSPSNFEAEKLASPFGFNGYKFPTLSEADLRLLANKYKGRPSYENEHYPIPELPIPEKYYADDMPPRPKKKNRPPKIPEYSYPSDDINDYILVPKKKFKNPPRISDDYRHEDDDYERPQYSNDDDDDDDRHRQPNRGEKKIVRKIIKKRKPVINLLDILDI
ncbi:uncharacterized protein LOC134665927 [Cydia fagiglandana]|uniref:uncharacterized protein LOC134665927 n=1 Tax=Cydia fagiglandana TaxID=1458189 RepID=UPI002FEE06F6